MPFVGALHVVIVGALHFDKLNDHMQRPYWFGVLKRKTKNSSSGNEE